MSKHHRDCVHQVKIAFKSRTQATIGEAGNAALKAANAWLEKEEPEKAGI